MKANKTRKKQAVPNHRRRKGKKVKSNIVSAAHNQTLNQQRQLHDRGHHVLKRNPNYHAVACKYTLSKIWVQVK
jgi:hypothetical protein